MSTILFWGGGGGGGVAKVIFLFFSASLSLAGKQGSLHMGTAATQ